MDQKLTQDRNVNHFWSFPFADYSINSFLQMLTQTNKTFYNNRNKKSNKTPAYHRDIFRPPTLLKCIYWKNIKLPLHMPSISHWLILPIFKKFGLYQKHSFGRKRAFLIKIPILSAFYIKFIDLSPIFQTFIFFEKFFSLKTSNFVRFQETLVIHSHWTANLLQSWNCASKQLHQQKISDQIDQVQLI